MIFAVCNNSILENGVRAPVPVIHQNKSHDQKSLEPNRPNVGKITT